MTLTTLQVESTFSDGKLLKLCVELHPRIQTIITSYCWQTRKAQSRYQLPNVTDEGFVLGERSDFHPGENFVSIGVDRK